VTFAAPSGAVSFKGLILKSHGHGFHVLLFFLLHRRIIAVHPIMHTHVLIRVPPLL
jgi:hypothetical protein